MDDTGGDYTVSGFSSDNDSTEVQRRTPPSSSDSSPLQTRNFNSERIEHEDEGPLIRVAATRSRRPVTEISGNGNVAIFDTRNILSVIIGRKLAKQLNCGKLWLIKDYCGLFCAIMTWGLIFYAEFVVWFIIVPARAISWINLAIWQSFSFLALFSHCRAMMSDPGAIPIGNCTMDNLRRLGYASKRNPSEPDVPTIVYKCPRCACIKPDKSHHCSICKRCIYKMDHHCPWVNNCVGMLNQKYFILFTLYICLMSAHGIVIDLQFLFTCFSFIDPHAASRLESEAMNSAEAKSVEYQPICLRSHAGKQNDYIVGLSAGIIFVIFMLFEAVIFSLFTAIMCGTQIHALCTETSTIEAMKKTDTELGHPQNPRQLERSNSKSKVEKNSCFSPLGEAFGDRHPRTFLWLSPFHNHRLRIPGFMEPLFDESQSDFLSSIRTA